VQQPFALAILGIEYAMNMGRPDVDGYDAWVGENHGRAPSLSHRTRGLNKCVIRPEPMLGAALKEIVSYAFLLR
jgi:hypothetical protein